MPSQDQDQEFMYIGANELALAARLVQLFIFSVLAGLSTRDLFRGENGITPGLVTLAAGMVITTSLGVFVAVTVHPHSPEGLITIVCDDETYQGIVETWHAIGAVITAVGAVMMGRYVYGTNEHVKS